MRGLKAFGRDRQRGFVLIDSLVAVGIVGAVFSLLLAGMSLGARSSNEMEEQVTASRLTSSQLDLIKDATYLDPPLSYPAVPAPDGYTVENVVSAYPGGDENVQIVTVRVYRGGGLVNESDLVKVNR